MEQQFRESHPAALTSDVCQSHWNVITPSKSPWCWMLIPYVTWHVFWMRLTHSQKIPWRFLVDWLVTSTVPHVAHPALEWSVAEKWPAPCPATIHPMWALAPRARHWALGSTRAKCTKVKEKWGLNCQKWVIEDDLFNIIYICFDYFLAARWCSSSLAKVVVQLE